MKRKIISIQNQYQKELNGQVGFLLFCFMNLCVKTDASALLSAEFNLRGKEVPLEELADVAIHDQLRFCLVPKNESYIPLIIKGILREHPELKPSIVKVVDKQFVEVDNDDESEMDQKLILLTIPDVNEDRHDVLLQGVDAFYDSCKLKMEASRAACTANLVKTLKGVPVEMIDEVKEDTEKIYEKFVKTRDGLKEEKIKEIEEAYQRYLTKAQEEESKQQEAAAAKGENVGFSMKMSEDETDG